mmetsp:Transcript_47729/g.102284  ORF Transcript_47729/g.102284 Transcript_47729/m.102284 type:complete len:205 (-) Transcript_47729:760-1374(-)
MERSAAAFVDCALQFFAQTFRGKLLRAHGHVPGHAGRLSGCLSEFSSLGAVFQHRGGHLLGANKCARGCRLRSGMVAWLPRLAASLHLRSDLGDIHCALLGCNCHRKLVPENFWHHACRMGPYLGWIAYLGSFPPVDAHWCWRLGTAECRPNTLALVGRLHLVPCSCQISGRALADQSGGGHRSYSLPLRCHSSSSGLPCCCTA